MKTIYDWITIATFAALITLFLNRSTSDKPRDKLIEYAPAAIGCAVVNYLGNNGYNLFGLGLMVIVIAYIWVVLKPLSQ